MSDELNEKTVQAMASVALQEGLNRALIVQHLAIVAAELSATAQVFGPILRSLADELFSPPPPNGPQTAKNERQNPDRPGPNQTPDLPLERLRGIMQGIRQRPYGTPKS